MGSELNDAALPYQARISVQRYFEVSLLFMVGASFLTLALTGRLDAVSMLLFSAGFGVKLWSCVRGGWFCRFESATVTWLALGYLAFFALDFAFLEPGPGAGVRLLGAAIHLILFSLLVEIFSARRYRDYAAMAVLSFLVILVSAVLTVGSFYLVGLALYVLFSISTFVSFEVKQGIDRSGRIAPGPFKSRELNRIALEKSLGAMALALALGIALLASAFFFIIPRIHTLYFSPLGLPPRSVTGFSENVSLGGSGSLAQSSQVEMRVKVDGNPRRFRGMLWRGAVLGRFTGKVWYSGRAGLRRLSAAPPGRYAIEPREDWEPTSSRLLRYQVLLAPLPADVLFLAARPRDIVGRFSAVAIDQADAVYTPGREFAPAFYSAVSDTTLPPVSKLRLAGSDYPAHIRQDDLSLPPLDPRIAMLARQVAKQAANNYDRAQAIDRYLRRNFAYTLEPTGISPQHPLSSFLFVARKGYCSYFASAMAVMLRSLGIPSRLVSGFRNGVYNQVGGDFIVRADDAHSWVEAYFPPYGWVPFDPTPATPAGLADQPVSGIDAYLDAANLFWSEWIIHYDFAHQAALAQRANRDSEWLRGEGRTAFRWFQAAGARWTSQSVKGLIGHKALLGMILLLASMIVLVRGNRRFAMGRLRLRAAIRSRRPASPGKQRDATVVYGQFLKLLSARGYERNPSQTPQEFAASLPDSALSPAALEFTRLYNSLRFGRPGRPCGGLGELVKLLSRLVRAHR